MSNVLFYVYNSIATDRYLDSVELCMVGVKRECNVITLQRNYSTYFILKLQFILCMYYVKQQMVLHTTTDCTINNYTKLQIELCAHATHTHKVSHTQSQHFEVAMYKYTRN